MQLLPWLFAAALLPLNAALATPLPQLTQQDILIKSAYNRMLQMDDGWFLWHDELPNGFIDLYKQGVSGQLLFIRRLYLQDAVRYYNIGAEEELLPALRTVKPFGQFVLARDSYGQLSLFDAEGTPISMPAANQAALANLVDLTSLNDGRWLSLHWDGTNGSTLQLWQQQPDGMLTPTKQAKSQLYTPFSQLLTLAGKVFLFQPDERHLLEINDSLQVSRTLPIAINDSVRFYPVDATRLAVLDNSIPGHSGFNRIRLVTVGTTLEYQHADDLQVSKFLGNNAEQLWYLNDKNQFCRVDLATLQQQQCEALPDGETTLSAGLYHRGLLTLTGDHGLYLAGNNSGIRRQKSLLDRTLPSRSDPALFALGQLSSGQLISSDGLLLQADTLLAGGSQPLPRVPMTDRGCLPSVDQMPVQPLKKTLYQLDSQWQLAEQYQDCMAIFNVHAGDKPELVLQSTYQLPARTQLYAHNHVGELVFISDYDNPSKKFWRKKPQDNQLQPISSDITSSGNGFQQKFFPYKEGYLVLTATRNGADLYQLGQTGQPAKLLGQLPTRQATVLNDYVYLWQQNKLEVWQVTDSGLTQRSEQQLSLSSVHSLTAKGQELFVLKSLQKNDDITHMQVFDLHNPQQPVAKYQPYPFSLWTAGNNVQPWRFGEQLLVPLPVMGGVLQLQQLELDATLPMVSNQLETAEDTTLNAQLQLEHADGRQIAIGVQPRQGSATLTGTMLRLQPKLNFFGTDQLTLLFTRAEQRHEMVLPITVTPVNDAPFAHQPSNREVQAGQLVKDQLSVVDVDGDPISYKVISQTGLTPTGTITFEPSGIYSYQAPAGAGVETIKVQASDPHGAATTITFTVTVKAAPPVLQPPEVDYGKSSGGSFAWPWLAMLTLIGWRHRHRQ